jgi:hypothetical protein
MLVQDQVLWIQVHRHHLPVLTLVQVVVVPLQDLDLQQPLVDLVVPVLSSSHILPK